MTNGTVQGKCRVCGRALFASPLLAYANMPGAAQGFPDQETLSADRGADLVVRQCSCCGLVQLDLAPVPYYREVIRAAAFSEEMGRFRQAQFAAWVERYDLRGRPVLEVGCGRGEYLSLLQQAGCRAHGLEYSASAVAACRKAGLAASRGFLPGRRLAAGPFAAFVSLNFMEHWPRPTDTLRAIADNLEPGGLGLVEVPDFDMILRQGLYSEFISDHLSYFTRESFSFALQLGGFEVLECTTVWHGYILSAVVRKRVATDLALLETRRAERTAALKAFIARFPPGRVAVWGAGHQALATIALSGIAGDLRYVVDSAPFKQGRYTPASHLPIVSPDTLDSQPVDAVIVMAASYSDEVARQLAARPGPRPRVAILRDHGLELCP